MFSNACKFTPAGGQLTITTRLILPRRNASGTSPHDSGTLTVTEISKEAQEFLTPPLPTVCKESPDGESYSIYPHITLSNLNI